MSMMTIKNICCGLASERATRKGASQEKSSETNTRVSNERENERKMTLYAFAVSLESVQRVVSPGA